MRATCRRTEGVRHLLAAYELGEDRLFGHVKPRKTRTRFLEFSCYLRSLYPPSVRIAIICDDYSSHLSNAPVHTVERVLDEPHRGPVHGAALLRPRRHRPRHP